MITPDSRYQDAAKTFTVGHTYDEFGRTYLNGDDVTPIPRTVVHETLFRLTVPSPSPVSPVQYLVKEGETMAFAAWKLMNGHSNWWKIAEVNQQVWYPLDTPAGTTLNIPV